MACCCPRTGAHGGRSGIPTRHHPLPRPDQTSASHIQQITGQGRFLLLGGVCPVLGGGSAPPLLTSPRPLLCSGVLAPAAQSLHPGVPELLAGQARPGEHDCESQGWGRGGSPRGGGHGSGPPPPLPLCWPFSDRPIPAEWQKAPWPRPAGPLGDSCTPPPTPGAHSMPMSSTQCTRWAWDFCCCPRCAGLSVRAWVAGWEGTAAPGPSAPPQPPPLVPAERSPPRHPADALCHV